MRVVSVKIEQKRREGDHESYDPERVGKARDVTKPFAAKGATPQVMAKC